jgi:leucyl/phenylalanyl-tRNA---protein transferase
MRPVPLTPRILEFAYRQGYFPMSDPDTGETNWYRPDPRAILPLDGFHCSRRLARRLKKEPWRITYDSDFTQVMRHCAERAEGSWISEEFVDAYTALQHSGRAHSLEVWLGDELAGGVYGVALGGGFFAESMFHRVTDGSKVALYHLVKRLSECGYVLLETQFLTPHLQSLGAIEISDTEYEKRLKEALSLHPSPFA